MGAQGFKCCQPPPKPNEVTVCAKSSDRADAAEETEEFGMSEEENNRRLHQMKSGGRRCSMSAPVLTQAEVKDYVKPVYQKDDATRERIRGILKGNDKMQVLFGHLDGAALNDVVNAFQETCMKKDREIIRQGEQGECLYILDSGKVDVYVARPGPDGKLDKESRGSWVASLGQGALFGELALMYSSPRAATVVAIEDCKVFQLDQEPFKKLLAQQSQIQFATYEGWLSEVEILKSLNKYELARLSELLESTPFDAGEDIVVQGEAGDKFYLLEDGSCAAYISGDGGEKKVRDYERQGDYFGEVALLIDEPRKATVRATGEGALVLSISKEDFTSILGPIQEILKKDIGKYPQYASFLAG